MERTDLPVMVPMQQTELPVMVPVQPAEMPVTEMPMEFPPPSDNSGLVHKEIRFFIVVGFIVIGGLVSIVGIFLFKGIGIGGPTTAIEKEGALTPHLEKIGKDIRSMPPRVKEATTSAKPPIMKNTLPSPKEPSVTDEIVEDFLTTPSWVKERTTPPTKGETSSAPTEPSSRHIIRADPLPRNMMVCTVNGEGPDLEYIRHSPPSMCGVIFFDSLFKEYRPEVAERFKKNYQSFLEWPITHPDAKFGMSISLETQKLATNVDAYTFVEEMERICKKNISHMAVINFYGDRLTDRDFTMALRVLQIAHRTLQECKPPCPNNICPNDKPPEPAYFVLGASIDQPTAERLVVLMKQHFVPSLFISISHVSYDDRKRHDCRILPPTWLDTPENLKQTDFTYGRPLVESCSVLPVLANGVGIPVAISFSLSGRMYKPRFERPASPTPEEYELFRPCQTFDGNYYVSPPQICKNVTQLTNKVNTTKFGVFTFDTSMERTLTFDNEETLKKKVCATKEKCGGVQFGLATYDVNYDAERLDGKFPACLKFGMTGSFSRCDVLHKMHGYLASLSTKSPWNQSACLTHVKGIQT